MSFKIDPFIIIVDCEGTVVEHFGGNAVIDEVMRVVDQFDKLWGDCAPHLALRWEDGYFSKITDAHPTSLGARNDKTIKNKNE